MTALNDAASAAARAAGAHAMTDVTGFGLLGHLHSLGRASGVAAVIDASAVPAIDGVLELLAGDDGVSGGSRRNRDYAETFTTFGPGVARGAAAPAVRRHDVGRAARRGRARGRAVAAGPGRRRDRRR